MKTLIKKSNKFYHKLTRILTSKSLHNHIWQFVSFMYFFWWWWWWIVFVVWLTDKRRLALFPAGTTVRDPHHHESPTHLEQGLNLHVSEIRDGEDLWKWSPLEIRLNAFCRSTVWPKLKPMFRHKHYFSPSIGTNIIKIY